MMSFYAKIAYLLPRQRLNIQGGPKKWTPNNFIKILANFNNFFTITITLHICNKMTIKSPPHLKRVATLPCEIDLLVMSENCALWHVLLTDKLSRILTCNFKLFITSFTTMRKLMKHFPNKGWKGSGLENLITKLLKNGYPNASTIVVSRLTWTAYGPN